MSFLQDFDVANFLPAPGAYMQSLVGWVRFLVLIVPLILLGLGAWYYFKPPKQINCSVGFRTYCNTGSQEVWDYSQRLAGFFYMITGGGLLVIMGIISLTFSSRRAMGMIITALVCVIIQLILVVALWFTLSKMISKAYDQDGKRRPKV